MPIGIAKIIPSTLSRKPPCPGNKLLVSLTLALRFSSEINKSPNCEVIDTNIVIMIRIKTLLEINSSIKKGIKVNENINDPIDPEIVLFGLILVSFLPLKILPKISPPTSDNIATKTEYNKYNFKLG